MESTQERVVNGLIELWADVYSAEIYFVQGKRFTARQLKPYVKAALAEPGSSVQGFFEASPEIAGACATYADLSTGPRKIILILAGKEIEDKLYLFKRLFYGMAMIYIITGLTAAEAEKRFEKSFERELTHITLNELLGKPKESNLHTWLSIFPLFPGSIAGADKRLKTVLVSHLKTVSGDAKVCPEVTYYEQDLKIAILECWKGQHSDVAIKMLGKNPTEQMATLNRIMDGQDPELLRTMGLGMIRKTIEELPDIHQEVRKLETQGRELPLTEEVLATIPSKHDDFLEPSPADLLEHIGISRDNTSEAEWQVFMMLSQKVLDGELEVGSKTGLSISAALGKDASRVRKTISRYRERQLNR